MSNLFKIGGLLLAINLIAALILSDYDWGNAAISSLVIVANVLLIIRMNKLNLKDGFSIGLGVLLPILGLIEFCLAAFSGPGIEDNGCIIAALVLVGFQCVLLIVCKSYSKSE